MEFGLLGPLLIRDGSSIHPISSARQRALLAALLLRAGWAIHTDQLIDTLWDDGPPRTAEVTLRNFRRPATRCAPPARRRGRRTGCRALQACYVGATPC